jgi:hypothetical protein
VNPVPKAEGIGRPYPGCAAQTVTLAPTATKNETRQENNIDAKLTIYGGIKPEHWVMSIVAAKKAMVKYVESKSLLLQKTLPTENDVEASLARRLLQEALAEDTYAGPGVGDARRLNDTACVDDDAAFAKEVSKKGMSHSSCQAMMKAEGLPCGNTEIYDAILVGCQKTCGLCANITTTAAVPASLQGTGYAVKFKIKTTTTSIAAIVQSRINQLKADPTVYVQKLYVELEKVGLPPTGIPAKMWVSVTTGPIKTLIAPPAVIKVKPDGDSGSVVTVAVIISVGGSIGLGCLFVLLWYCLKRRQKWRKVHPEPVKTKNERSEGGYRFKEVQVGGGETPPPPEPDCLERLCMRMCGPLYRKCCVKKLRKAQAASNFSDDRPIVPGCTVKLFGLNKAEYNGLTGVVLSGPNDKGRYEIDISVNYANTEEHQTLSFKPENMRVVDELRETAGGIPPTRVPAWTNDSGTAPYFGTGPYRASADGTSQMTAGIQTGSFRTPAAGVQTGSYRNSVN